ncbi:uncharacterized protein KGF55_004942 [Candida pseudojiufengensis]|uniref:uncharacterized protein n=1 Tax=Candida pseudojiufengensis TaxID=497109 RepID=UPI00222501A4|nr:uncharacterized protein KGF55_004942 [Candida pseudojiufengensis]KAI5959710.1 hypothetical protein KGF55_004942 [Candida pseudojiufengensis]
MTDYKPINQEVQDQFEEFNNNPQDFNKKVVENTTSPYFQQTPPPPFPPFSIPMNYINQTEESGSSQAGQDLQNQNQRQQPQECTPRGLKFIFCMSIGSLLFTLSLFMVTIGETKTIRVWGLFTLIIGLYLILTAGSIVFEVDKFIGNEKFLKYFGLGFLGSILLSLGAMILGYFFF